jgi:hypothetical protein
MDLMSEPPPAPDLHDRFFVHHARGFFDQAVMERVRTHFDQVEGSYQTRGSGPRDEWAIRLGVGTDSMRFDRVWYDLWRHLPAASERLLGSFTWLIFPPQVRHIRTASQLVPWHQDLAYQRLLGARAHHRVITCFVPLEPRPDLVAGLEFADGNRMLHPHLNQGDHGACIVDPSFGPALRFTLSHGDVILFGDHAPHRTIPGPDGTIDRRSFEFRLVEPKDALDDKDYFDITRRKFTRTDGSERDHP